MEEEKRKKIEAKLRHMLMLADQSREENRPAAESKPPGIRVIRRRKGEPDMQIHLNI